MPIQINPLNDQALASLANMRVSNLNLPTASLDLGAPMKGAATGILQAAQQQSLFAQDLAKTNLENQGKIQLQQEANKPTFQANEINRQYYGSLLQNAQTELKQKQQTIDQTGDLNKAQIQNYAAQQQQAKDALAQTTQNDQTNQYLKYNQQLMDYNQNQITNKMNMSKYQNDQLGALGATLQFLRQQNGGVVPPDQQAALLQQTVSSGVITPEQADAYKNSPNQIQDVLEKHEVFTSGQAKDLVDEGVVSPALGTANQANRQKSQAENQQLQIIIPKIQELNKFINDNPQTVGVSGLAANSIGTGEDVASDLTGGLYTPGNKSYAAVKPLVAKRDALVDSINALAAQGLGGAFGSRTQQVVQGYMPDFSTFKTPEEATEALSEYQKNLTDLYNTHVKQNTGQLSPNAPLSSVPGMQSQGLTLSNGQPLNQQQLEAFNYYKQKDPSASDAYILNHIEKIANAQ